MSTNFEKLEAIFDLISKFTTFSPEDSLFGSHCPYIFRNKTLEEVLDLLSEHDPEAVTEAYNCFSTSQLVEDYVRDDEYSGPVGTIVKYPYLDNLHVEYYGRYQSHWGTEYEDMREVTPIEKTITAFEAVK